MRSKQFLVMAAALAASLGACKSHDDDKTPAAPAPATTPAPAPAKDTIKPFFFKVEKDGKTDWLFGTVHDGVDPSRIPAYVYTQLDAAKVFAMETDLSDPMKVIADLTMPPGETLQQDLGPEYWKKLQDAMGAPMATNLNGYRPTMAVQYLQLNDMPHTAQMDPTLMERARKHGARIAYLEDVKVQEAALIKWMDTTALKEALDEREKGTVIEQQMLDAYARGDADTLVRLTLDREDWKRGQAEFDAQMQDLLYARNTAWIPVLEQLFADGDAFVAVGAAHLLGEGSVVDLLAKKGYTVTRVES